MDSYICSECLQPTTEIVKDVTLDYFAKGKLITLKQNDVSICRCGENPWFHYLADLCEQVAADPSVEQTYQFINNKWVKS